MLILYLSVLDTQEEKDKFEQLYINYKKLVYCIAYKYMSEKNLAEDATQETFLKLTKYIDTIENVDSPKTVSFLTIIAKSVCLDLLRSEKTYIKNTKKYHDEQPDNTEDIYNMLDTIRKLPESYRDVLILKYYFDMPTRKIATIYKISDNSVRKRLERAKKMIREAKL